MLLPLLIGLAPAQDPADLILTHAAVWTVDPDRPRAEALAVRGARIVRVGDADDMAELIGEGTRVIDLGGRLLLPGFVDNHVHFASAARFLEFNIMNVTTQAGFRGRVAEVVARLEDGEWILGGFWGAYDAWAEGSAGGEAREPFTPDLAAVADLIEQHPVYLRRFDGTQLLVDAKALRAAHLDPDDPAVGGVEFVRDDQGRPTGLCRGPGARFLFDSAAPAELSHARRLSQTRHALAAAARAGVTTVSDMSDDLQLELYRELAAAGELTLRIHWRTPLDRWQELAEAGIRAGDGDDWIRMGSLKGHIDGIMGTSSARFFEPYVSDPENRGRWRRLMLDAQGDPDPEGFLGLMLSADRAGLQVTVHAIGDEANHLLLEFVERLNERNGPRDRRFRLVHAQVLAAADFQRLGPLGIVAEVQPFHLADDMRWMEERIGRQRCAGAYAFKSLRSGGAVLCFGTDWPGTSASEYPIDPILGLHAAVTRTTRTGAPEGGWFPDERITIEEALQAYTLASAYANFEEQAKGSITPGKLADLCVLSRNLLEEPPERILGTECVLTVVGGRVVYDALDQGR